MQIRLPPLPQRMTSFSAMTASEFVRMNRALIPAAMLDAFEQMEDDIAGLEHIKEMHEKREERQDEQLYFARNLVQELDAFAKANLSKAKLAAYQRLRDNTSFEL